MEKKSFIICCTVKNEAKTLKKFFRTLNNLIKNIENYFIIFVLSDSYDDSKNLIVNFLKNKKGILLEKNFKNEIGRFAKLETCRNFYLEYISNDEELSKFTYMLVLDVDGVNNLLNYRKLNQSIQKESWNGIFASQKLFYYDIFALRKKKYLETDCFKKLKSEIKISSYFNYKNIFYDNISKFFFIKKHFKVRYISVDSAFGGCGIYKLKTCLNYRYNSKNNEVCEHVGFNEQISKNFGGLYIDTSLTNSYGLNLHTINGLLCSISSFMVKRFIKRL